MTSSHDTQDTAGDMDARLRGLIAKGFQFLHPKDASGDVVAVVGVRAHDNVVDVVRLQAEDDVAATRVPGDEPDIMAPQRTLWKVSGPARMVLDEMLALPDDRTPGSLDTATTERKAATAKGCWVRQRPGHAKWLAATG